MLLVKLSGLTARQQEHLEVDDDDALATDQVEDLAHLGHRIRLDEAKCPVHAAAHCLLTKRKH